MSEITIQKKQIISILNRYDIEYTTQSKNVSGDCFGVQCPFCNDHSDHCGIFYPGGAFHCWRCNESGSLYSLLRELVGITLAEYNAIIKTPIAFDITATDQIKNILSPSIDEAKKENEIDIALPEYCEIIDSNTNSHLLNTYLSRRGYTIEDCVNYSCLLCTYGKYIHRLIIPVIYNNELVSFQGADLTGKSRLKYKSAGNKINNFLYNYDRIIDKAIVTEGILDAWRIGNEAVCTFGTSISDKQRKLIIDLQLKELIFAWDGDAYWKARKQASYFSPYIKTVKTLCLPKGEDPDSLGNKKMYELIDTILLQGEYNEFKRISI